MVAEVRAPGNSGRPVYWDLFAAAHSSAMQHELDENAHDLQVVETEKPAHANVVRRALTSADE